MACGAKAPALTLAADVPSSHQLLFALLAGGMMGSRLGSTSALVYLVAAAALGNLWPVGAGPAPLTGHLAGYLWSLPFVAYAAGYATERLKLETPAIYAIGIAAGVGTYDAFGAAGLVLTADHFDADAYLRGAAANTGLRIAHGALAVFITSSATAALHTKSKG